MTRREFVTEATRLGILFAALALVCSFLLWAVR